MATTLDTRETTALIGSDKVDGTAVYGADQKKIGSIERVMIDKISGKVAFAVLTFGGFLGMGEDFYPLPWSTLRYDTSLGGYRTNLTKEQLDKAPKYSASQGWNWNRDNERRIYSHYQVQPYWEQKLDKDPVRGILRTGPLGAEDMPEIVAGSLSTAFGDFNRGYLVVDRAGISVLRDPYTAKPYVLFYTTKRVGGGVQDFDAIKVMKFAVS